MQHLQFLDHSVGLLGALLRFDEIFLQVAELFLQFGDHHAFGTIVVQATFEFTPECLHGAQMHTSSHIGAPVCYAHARVDCDA